MGGPYTDPKSALSPNPRTLNASNLQRPIEGAQEFFKTKTPGSPLDMDLESFQLIQLRCGSVANSVS